MLEESHSISTITFKSQLGAHKALEYYLSTPWNHPGLYNYKLLGDVPGGPKRLFIKKLEQALEKLGSVTVAVGKVQKPKSDPEDSLDILSEILEEALPKEPSEVMKLYMKLGRLIGLINSGIELTHSRQKWQDHVEGHGPIS